MNSFSELTAETKYWVGYLLADGGVHGGRISLGSIDLDVIQSFKSFVGIDNDIKIREAGKSEIMGKVCNLKEYYTYSFSNIEIVTLLEAYGLVPNKTAIARAPELLKMDKDFWRGNAVEANGHLGIDTQGRGILEMTCGSEVMCQQFLDYCKSLIPISKVNVTKESGGKLAWRVRFCGRYSSYILRHLYQDASVIMTRKHSKALEIIELYKEELAVLDSIPACNKCASKKTVKDGKGRTGAQRYLCRDCGSKFIPIENHGSCGRKYLNLSVSTIHPDLEFEIAA